jgi:ATP-dependent exoDNAse (exonuclease V) beta subunit
MNKGDNILKRQIARILQLDEESRQINFLDQRFYKRQEHYYPSITYVLSFFPKGRFFEDWLKQVGQNADYLAQKAAETGTQVHNLIEKYLNLKEGEEILWVSENYTANYSLEVWKMFLKFIDFWETYKPQLLETEVHLFSDEHKIAGTCDLVLEINGVIWILDIKTSNSLHTSYDLQTAAYAKCWNESFDKKVERSGILWLKSQKRGSDKTGKKIQGKGWEIYESSRSIDENWSYFEKVYDLFKLENPNAKPIFETLPLKVKRNF